LIFFTLYGILFINVYEEGGIPTLTGLVIHC